MSPWMQELVVYAAVALAGGWLLRRWLRRRSTSACERCGPKLASPPQSKGIRSRSLRVLR